MLIYFCSGSLYREKTETILYRLSETTTKMWAGPDLFAVVIVIFPATRYVEGVLIPAKAGIENSSAPMPDKNRPTESPVPPERICQKRLRGVPSPRRGANRSPVPHWRVHGRLNGCDQVCPQAHADERHSPADGLLNEPLFRPEPGVLPFVMNTHRTAHRNHQVKGAD